VPLPPRKGGERKKKGKKVRGRENEKKKGRSPRQSTKPVARPMGLGVSAIKKHKENKKYEHGQTLDASPKIARCQVGSIDLDRA